MVIAPPPVPFQHDVVSGRGRERVTGADPSHPATGARARQPSRADRPHPGEVVVLATRSGHSPVAAYAHTQNNEIFENRDLEEHVAKRYMSRFAWGFNRTSCYIGIRSFI